MTFDWSGIGGFNAVEFASITFYKYQLFLKNVDINRFTFFRSA